MSSEPTKLTSKLIEYVYSNFSAEDKFLADLKSEANKKGFPDISIAPDQGRFLQFQLNTINAKYVLEIGGLAGYSAISMARALPAYGKLITLEINREYAEFIKMKAREASMDKIIEVKNVNAREFLEDYKPEFSLDFVFIDADKVNYRYYLDKVTPLLRIGGIVVADNALGFGYVADEHPEHEPHNVIAIQKFNEYIGNHPQFRSCLVTMGDGMVMGVKIK